MWGFVAQGLSSAVNLGLSVLAGQLLGPRGLGIVYLGFVSYQLILGLQRGVITQPLIAHAAPLAPAERLRMVKSGLTVVLLCGAVASLIVGLSGFALGGDLGRGLLLFAPWILAALLQEFWKAILFQEGKGRAGAFSEVARLGVLVLALPLVLAHRSDYIIVGVWGVGAAVGFGVGFIGLHTPLGPAREALTWLRRDAWALGRWLGAREIIYQLGIYLTVVVLALVIGSKDLGGLRSAEALFSPFSLIAAAFLLPALPALSRELAISHHGARQLVLKMTGVAVALGAGYFLIMALIGRWLLIHVFGSAFASYDGLIWPMATTQLLAASAFAFGILLIAERRGSVLVAAAIIGSTATFGFATGLGAVMGVTGAAWGLTAAGAISALTIVVAAERSNRGAPPGTTEDLIPGRANRLDGRLP